MKTKGILDETGVKNFEITSDSGDIYIALRQPNGKFTVGDDGVCRTLKQCKDAVLHDAVVFFADKVEESVEKIWDHVDSNALLILSATTGCCMPEIMRTLDANGWVTPEGKMDTKLAQETYDKWSK